MATYPSILAWKFQGQRNLVGYSSWSQKVSDMTEQLTHTHTHTHVHTHTHTVLTNRVILFLNCF